ncbi:MAG TPA: response regulator transcription factor [Thermoanaerobaculia bacterium]|nr:response regulator transcription factor [Thermoanaerobaculia bacterium]
MSDRITILLVDDLPVVRQGLRALLAAEPSLAVVGEAASGALAVELAAQLTPDVVLVHLLVSGLAGVELVRRVKRLKLPTRVVVLSAANDAAAVAGAMASGADGWVGREASAADLVHALQEVAAGRRYLSPPFTEQQLERYALRAASSGADLYASLTARERQVLELAADGLRNREIAERLGISPRTAESHRAKVMSKLGLRREADLVRFALRHGILLLDGEAPEVS